MKTRNLGIVATVLILTLLAIALTDTATAATDPKQGCTKITHNAAAGTRYIMLTLDSTPSPALNCANEPGYKLAAGACATWYGAIATTGSPPTAPNNVEIYVFADTQQNDHGTSGNTNWASPIYVGSGTPASFDGLTLSLCATDTAQPGGNARAGTYRVILRACAYVSGSGCPGSTTAYDVNSDPGSSGGNAGGGNTVTTQSQGAYIGGFTPTCFTDGLTAGGANIDTYVGGDTRGLRLCGTQAIKNTGIEDVTLQIWNQAATATLDATTSTGLRTGTNADATFPTALTNADAYTNNTAPTKRATITQNSALLGEPWTYFVAAPADSTLASPTRIDAPWGLVDKGSRITCPTLLNPNSGTGTVNLLMIGENAQCRNGLITNARNEAPTTGTSITINHRRASQSFADTTDAPSCDTTTGSGGTWTCDAQVQPSATPTHGGTLDYALDIRTFTDGTRTVVTSTGTLTGLFDVSDTITLTCPTLLNPSTGTGTVTLLNPGEKVQCRGGIASNARGEPLKNPSYLRIYYRRASDSPGSTTDAASCDATTGPGGTWTCDRALNLLATPTAGGSLDYVLDARQYSTSGRTTLWNTATTSPIYDVSDTITLTCPTLLNPNTLTGTVTKLEPGESRLCRNGQLLTARGDPFSYGAILRTYDRRASDSFGSTTDAPSCDTTTNTTGGWTCDITLPSGSTNTDATGSLDFVLDVRQYSSAARSTVVTSTTLTPIYDISHNLTISCPTHLNPNTGTGSVTTLNAGEISQCRDGIATNSRGEPLQTGSYLRVNTRRASDSFGSTTDAPSCDTTTNTTGGWTCDTTTSQTATPTTGGSLDYVKDARRFATAARTSEWTRGTTTGIFDIDTTICPSTSPTTCTSSISTDRQQYVLGDEPLQTLYIFNARNELINDAVTLKIIDLDTSATERTATPVNPTGNLYTYPTYTATTGTDRSLPTLAGAPKALRIEWQTTNTHTTGAEWNQSSLIRLDSASSTTSTPNNAYTYPDAIRNCGQPILPTWHLVRPDNTAYTRTVTAKIVDAATSLIDTPTGNPTTPTGDTYTTSFTPNCTTWTIPHNTTGAAKKLRLEFDDANTLILSQAGANATSRLDCPDIFNARSVTDPTEYDTFVIGGHTHYVRLECYDATGTPYQGGTATGLRLDPDSVQDTDWTWSTPDANGRTNWYKLNTLPPGGFWTVAGKLEDQGNTGYRNETIAYATAYTSIHKVIITGVENVTSPGTPYHFTFHTMTTTPDGVLVPITPVGLPSYALNYTDGQGHAQNLLPITTPTPVPGTTNSWTATWNVPNDWPAYQQAWVTFHANLSGAQIIQTEPLTIGTSGGTDPLKVTCAPTAAWPGTTATCLLAASFLNATANTGANANLIGYYNDTTGSLLHGPTLGTELGAGSGIYAFTWNIPPTQSRGSVAFTVATDDGRNAQRGSTIFFIGHEPAHEASTHNQTDYLATRNNATSAQTQTFLLDALDYLATRNNATSADTAALLDNVRTYLADHINTTAAPLARQTALLLVQDYLGTLDNATATTGQTILLDVLDYVATLTNATTGQTQTALLDVQTYLTDYITTTTAPLALENTITTSHTQTRSLINATENNLTARILAANITASGALTSAQFYAIQDTIGNLTATRTQLETTENNLTARITTTNDTATILQARDQLADQLTATRTDLTHHDDNLSLSELTLTRNNADLQTLTAENTANLTRYLILAVGTLLLTNVILRHRPEPTKRPPADSKKRGRTP